MTAPTTAGTANGMKKMVRNRVPAGKAFSWASVRAG